MSEVFRVDETPFGGIGGGGTLSKDGSGGGGGGGGADVAERADGGEVGGLDWYTSCRASRGSMPSLFHVNPDG